MLWGSFPLPISFNRTTPAPGAQRELWHLIKENTEAWMQYINIHKTRMGGSVSLFSKTLCFRTRYLHHSSIPKTEGHSTICSKQFIGLSLFEPLLIYLGNPSFTSLADFNSLHVISAALFQFINYSNCLSLWRTFL